MLGLQFYLLLCLLSSCYSFNLSSNKKADLLRREHVDGSESQKTGLQPFDEVKKWVAAGMLGSSLAFGGIVEPAVAAPTTTRIELNVETDYLLKVLDYFDGDMKKTLYPW